MRGVTMQGAIEPGAIGPGAVVRVALAVLGMLLVAGLAWSASWPRTEIVSETADRIVLSVTVPPYSLETVEANGRTYTRIMGLGLVPFAQEGQPDLPVIPVLLAVPPGGNARLVAVERSDQTRLEDVRVVPVESFQERHESERRPDDFANYVYAEDETIYGARVAFPSRDVWLADRGRLRHQDVVKVVLAPFVYEPVGQAVAVTRNFRVTVEFERAEGREGGLGMAPVREDAYEGLYRDAVVNYEQARRWRTAEAPGAGESRLGLQVDNQRVKIEIERTGFHTLSFDTLSALGFPQGVAVDDVFMYRDVFAEGASGSPDTLKATESAVKVVDQDANSVFSPGDRVEFYARDFYDEYGYRGNEDAFSNKNICWLSWGDGSHRRITARPGWRDAAAPETPVSFPDFIHVEQDSYFVNYPPEDDMDLYVWTRQRRITPFLLPGIDRSQPASLTVRFVNYLNYYPSTTICPRPSTVTLYMTGCGGAQVPIDAVTTAVPGIKVATVALPESMLCESGNVFRFESSLLDQSCSPGNLLDWFEIAYRRSYTADDDFLIFNNGGVTGELEYQVTGFSTSQVRLFEVTDATAPVEIDLGPDQIVPDGGGFKIVFRDSVGDSATYLALGASAAIGVSAGQADLRQPPTTRDTQANYLIISYPDFISEMNRIVARRQAQGHSVLAATTDEVYDDFGNGMPSDVAIKRFIKDAFYRGEAEFVLLVGDANSDHRGLFLTPRAGDSQLLSDPDYVPSHLIRRLEDERPNWELRPSDNWYVMVSGPGDIYPDLYLGRLPAGSTSEARLMVDKIVKFEDYAGADPWKKRVLVIADDEYKFSASDPNRLCYAGEKDFMWACDSVAVIAADYAMTALDTVKYYLRRCVQDDQPTLRCDNSGCCTNTTTTRDFTRAHCTPELVGLMNQSALLVNYQGHANRDRFTHESLILDGGNPTNPTAWTDIRGLTNNDKPFIFAGYGCWISEFVRRAEPYLQDAIGEKFLTAVNGGACACFASGCSEGIATNRLFNPYVARAIFSELQGLDPRGNPIPARVLIGEAVTTGLVRFAIGDYATRHLLFGDPAMVVDMGPPVVSVAVNDSTIDAGYVFQGEQLDTLVVVSEIKDEEAIMEITIDLVQGTTVTPVPADAFQSEALTDPGFARSRAYRTTYNHVPLLGNYVIRIGGEDYSGRQGSFDVHVNTGTASFYRGEALLAEGGSFDFGQTLRVVLRRASAFTADDIAATLDSVPASEFDTYSLVKKDQDGKEWEISLRPVLDAGDHTMRVVVQGFEARRTFQYVPIRVDFMAEGRGLFEGDFVSADAVVEIVIRTEPGFSGGAIDVDVDGEAQAVEFTPDETETEWRGMLDLGPLGLPAGDHSLDVTVHSITTTRNFRISEELALSDVSVFPNPFAGQTYFYYTLTESVDEAGLAIYTVAGRKIFEAGLSTFAGYNQYRWDGRDSTGDRVANGTYLYRVVVKSSRGEREFLGRLVKLD
jgi:hypothetical protein